MHKEQQDFFLACYFADYDRLKDMDVIGELKEFTFTYPLSHSLTICTGSPHLSLLPQEILKMSYDAWYDYRDKTSYYDDSSINPSLIFADTLKCLQLLNVDITSFEVRYTDYINLQYAMSRTDEWFYEKECAEMTATGLRQIDIDLFNAAKKNDKYRIISLLEQGADPAADIYQEEPHETIIDKYRFEDSQDRSLYLEYRKEYIAGLFIHPDEYRHMLSTLYIPAATCEMTRTIRLHQKPRTI